MNKWEKACREWLKSCSCASWEAPEECKECTDAFLNHLKYLYNSGDEFRDAVKEVTMRTEIKRDRRVGDRRKDVLLSRVMRSSARGLKRGGYDRLSRDIRPDGHVVVYVKRGKTDGV